VRLPGLVWCVLPNGEVDYVNRGWCVYTGASTEDALGSSWQGAIHPEDRPALTERWRAMLASGQPCEVQARVRRFDATYRLFLIRACALTDATGGVAKWSALATDIEEPMQAEQALHARWWLWAPAREHHFRWWSKTSMRSPHTSRRPARSSINRRATQYFGATIEQVKSWKISDIVYPEDLPNVLSAWNRVVPNGGTYHVEARVRRSDGNYRWFSMRGFP